MTNDLVELTFVAGVWLSATFVISALAKLRNQKRTRRDVESYRLVPGPLTVPVAAGLPAIELAIALGLLAGGWTRLAYVAAAMLLVTFSVAMAINLRRGRRISCGCRGSDTEISWRLVGQNVGLASLAILIAVTEPASIVGIVSEARLAPSEVWAYLIVALVGPLVARSAMAVWEGPFRPIPSSGSRSTA